MFWTKPNKKLVHFLIWSYYIFMLYIFAIFLPNSSMHARGKLFWHFSIYLQCYNKEKLIFSYFGSVFEKTTFLSFAHVYLEFRTKIETAKFKKKFHFISTLGKITSNIQMYRIWFALNIFIWRVIFFILQYMHICYLCVFLTDTIFLLFSMAA